jgi:glycosyltransferase involved in cell wall biosynthesis
MIVAYNEVDRVERAIRSVADLVDETLVVDSGSTDETVSLCERLGARVVHHPWGGFGPQKRFAEEAASYDWILSLDSDEWLTEELRAELAAILAAPLPPTRCFRARVRVVYPRRETPAPFAHYHKYVRLYNRTTARFRDSLTHDVVEPTADVVQLNGDILHKSYRDFAHIITKTVSLLPHAARGGDRAEPRRPLAHVHRIPLSVFPLLPHPPPHLRRRRRIRLCDRAFDRSLGADFHPDGVVR